MPDEILREIRQIREDYSLRFGGNVAAMFADLDASRKAAGRQAIRLPPKSPMRRVSREESLAENINGTDRTRQLESIAHSS